MHSDVGGQTVTLTYDHHKKLSPVSNIYYSKTHIEQWVQTYNQGVLRGGQEMKKQTYQAATNSYFHSQLICRLFWALIEIS